MPLTSKQRAFLRGQANHLEPIVQIGKDGVGDTLVQQTRDALEAREMIKCRVLENSLMTAREACDTLSVRTGSQPVQVIGNIFVLYRQQQDKSKRKYDLPKTAKKS